MPPSPYPPPRFPVLIPGSGNMMQHHALIVLHYMAKREFANVIKVTNQLT